MSEQECPSDEQTALLQTDVRPVTSTLPMGALATLSLLRVIDAISYTMIFPYIAALLEHVGTAPRNIGLYAGLAEGSLMLTEALTVPLWAQVGPRLGKTTCVQLGILISLVPTILTGFCTAAWQIVLCRLCIGLNPISLFAQALLKDITTPANRTRAYSIFTPSFTVGTMLGSILGGYGAQPSTDSAVGRLELFQQHPFLLPPLIYTVIAITTLVMSSGFVRKIESPKIASDEETAAASKPESNMWLDVVKCARVPGLVGLLSITIFYEAAKYEWDGVYPVFAYTKTSMGGLGLSVSTIGTLLAVSSLLYVVTSFTVYTRVHSVIGTPVLLPLTLACFPMLALSIPVSESVAATHRQLLPIFIGSQMVLRMGAKFSTQMIDASVMNLFDAHPEISTMAFALKIMAGAGGRAVGPAIAGLLFSRSRQYPANTFGHALGWLGIFVFGLPMCFFAIRLTRSGIQLQ